MKTHKAITRYPAGDPQGRGGEFRAGIEPLDAKGRVWLHRHPSYKFIRSYEGVDEIGIAMSRSYPNQIIKPLIAPYGLVGFVRYRRPLRRWDVSENDALLGYYYLNGAGKEYPRELVAPWTRKHFGPGKHRDGSSQKVHGRRIDSAARPYEAPFSRWEKHLRRWYAPAPNVDAARALWMTADGTLYPITNEEGHMNSARLWSSIGHVRGDDDNQPFRDGMVRIGQTAKHGESGDSALGFEAWDADESTVNNILAATRSSEHPYALYQVEFRNRLRYLPQPDGTTRLDRSRSLIQASTPDQLAEQLEGTHLFKSARYPKGTKVNPETGAGGGRFAPTRNRGGRYRTPSGMLAQWGTALEPTRDVGLIDAVGARLKGRGAELFMPPEKGWEAEIRPLLTRGKAWSTRGTKYLSAAEPHRCHWTATQFAARDPKRYKVVHGYARDDDGLPMWADHTWVWDTRSKCVIEPGAREWAKRTGYFGYEMTESEQRSFHSRLRV